jgi:PAS domain S-box-containing protein
MSLATSTDSTANLKTARRFPPRVFTEGLARFAVGTAIPHLHEALLVGLAYYAGAQVGFALRLQPSSVPILWPPDAVLLAGLLLMPVRSWALVLVAVLAVHLTGFAANGPFAAIGGFVSHSAGPLVSALVFRRFHPAEARFDTFRESVVLLGCAGVLAPSLSSLFDSTLASVSGGGEAGFWISWRAGFFARALAQIVLVPLIVTTVRGKSRVRQVPRRRWVEGGVIFVLLIAASWFVFMTARPGSGTSLALVYVPFALLVAAAVRLGPWGASASFAVVALMAIWGAAEGRGPFVGGSSAESALTIQLFLIIAWVPAVSLTALTQDRAHAEFKARQSEEQLGIALDAAQLGRWDWDIARQRLEWSDTTRRIYGVPLDVPVSPETFAALIHPDDRPLIEAATQEGLAGRPFEVEFRIVLPDGRVRWIMSRGKTLFDEAGLPRRMVGIKVDITARKQTELELKDQQRELAHIDRLAMVGELSVAIAHELNQPLAAILTNVGAARRFLSQDPPNIARVREIVDAIAQDNRRAASVIDKVRTFLRRDELPPAPLHLNNVVEDVLEIVRADMIARDVSVSTRLGRTLPAVTGDRVQLQQVLLNLVLNACDAMESTAHPRQLTVVTEGDARDRVRVTVRDSGPGVPGDQLERIFEPFVTSKPHGLGLGLAVCRSIITAYDGRLWAENNAGAGASFCFDLPGLNAHHTEFPAPPM